MSEISNEEIAAFNELLGRRMMQKMVKSMSNFFTEATNEALPSLGKFMISEMSKFFSDDSKMEEMRQFQEEAMAEELRTRTERLLTFEQRTQAFEALLEKVQRR